MIIYEDYFHRTNLESGYYYKWDLNKVPKDYNQILILAQLIQAQLDLNHKVVVRADKRKRAKGLPVVFVNYKQL